MSLDMLRIVMIGLRPSYNYKGNHIITLGVTQAHNGERGEPHNSKLRATKYGKLRATKIRLCHNTPRDFSPWRAAKPLFLLILSSFSEARLRYNRIYTPVLWYRKNNYTILASTAKIINSQITHTKNMTIEAIKHTVAAFNELFL